MARPSLLSTSALLLACACAQTEPVASTPDSAEAPKDALLVERLANLPKVRPWPIAWFEPKEVVRGADRPAPVPQGRAEPLLGQGAWDDAVAYSKETESDALLVWKDGKPDRVWYREGFDPQALTNTYYLNFFALVLAIGAALDEGAIASLEDPVAKYVEEWRGSPREAITVRDLLQMHSGLELYKDNIDPADKATRAFFGSYSTKAALEFTYEDEPGRTFEYNYIVPEVLGITLERATGRRYADYLSEKIWAPLGNSDAAVWLDRPGGRPHFNAALFADADDWMKFGAMIAGGGRFEGKRIVSQGFIEELAKPSPTQPNYGMTWLARPFETERRLSPEVSYVVKASEPIAVGDMLIFDGYGGQRVYVSPSRDLVIVRIGLPQRNNWDDARLPNIVAAGL